MKKVTKFFMAALLAGMCSFGYAQEKLNWEIEPETDQSIIGSIFFTTREYESTPSDNELYNLLLEEARRKYPNYPNVDIRSAKKESESIQRRNPNYRNPYDPNKEAFNYGYYKGYNEYKYFIVYKLTAVVVVPNINEVIMKKMNMTFDKALRNVREGSRLAIDNVSVNGVTFNREDLKDRAIDVLLDKGYKVVAKEYLERLYEEQQNQQSGIYNERTTVQENNFSAVGYYINVKVTETSLRVQVVNVSTGEYEGNATINF